MISVSSAAPRVVPFQPVPEIEDRRLIRPRAPRGQAHEALHRYAVGERVLHRRVAEVGAKLHAVNPQPRGQRMGWPPTRAGRIDRTNSGFHPLQKPYPSRLAWLPVVLHIGK